MKWTCRPVTIDQVNSNVQIWSLKWITSKYMKFVDVNINSITHFFCFDLEQTNCAV